MTKSATITSGPDVWKGKSGAVLFMDLDWVVVELISKDDCGLSVFNVRFPLGCVKVINELAVA